MSSSHMSEQTQVRTTKEAMEQKHTYWRWTTNLWHKGAWNRIWTTSKVCATNLPQTRHPQLPLKGLWLSFKNSCSCKGTRTKSSNLHYWLIYMGQIHSLYTNSVSSYVTHWLERHSTHLHTTLVRPKKEVTYDGEEGKSLQKCLTQRSFNAINPMFSSLT